MHNLAGVSGPPWELSWRGKEKNIDEGDEISPPNVFHRVYQLIVDAISAKSPITLGIMSSCPSRSLYKFRLILNQKVLC